MEYLDHTAALVVFVSVRGKKRDVRRGAAALCVLIKLWCPLGRLLGVTDSQAKCGRADQVLYKALAVTLFVQPMTKLCKSAPYRIHVSAVQAHTFQFYFIHKKIKVPLTSQLCSTYKCMFGKTPC